MSDKVKKEIFNSVNENVQALAKLFPSVVKDGEVDFDALKEELGEFVEVGAEKYDFTWAGKSKAKAEARDSGEGLTLKLKVGEGVNEDTTQNIYIEGDNLKALKLLRNSYYGAIKMIYIDPPYNTGKDFVYRDNFTLSQEELDELGNNLDDEGNRLEKNSGDSARYHTDWLNMVYPRLKIARDLLSEDGVIFISIDDNEVDNLQKICNEIFDECNFLGVITWAKKRKGSFLTNKLISLTEYCLVYAKNFNYSYLFGGKAEESESQPIIKRTNSLGRLSFCRNTVTTKLPDGVYQSGVYGEEVNPVILENDIEVRHGIIISDFSLTAHFVWSQAFLDNELQKGSRIVINTKNMQPRAFRIYGESNFKGFGSFVNGVSICGTNEDAYEELEELFKIKKLFDYSKPKNYLKTFFEAGTHFDKNAIILDFFSGSATTAHAVMQLNAEDGGNRKYICVQIPEKCEEDSEAYKAGYKNICEIGKERIRRAGKKIIEENPDKNDTLDIGFKVFEVAETNIRMFSEEMKGNDLFDLVKETDKELRDFMPETKDIDVCYELLLRHRGVALSSSIEKLDIGERTYIIADSIVVCLDSKVTEEMVEKLAVIDPQPMKYIFRDSAFGDDISLKENTMIMLSALIEKTTGDSKKAYKVEFI